jgi:hypothetical protein
MQLTASGSKYKIDYPSLKCGGEWRIVSLGLETATFKERITDGKDKCVDDGNVVIERLNVNQLAFRHSAGEIFQNILNCHPRSTNTRLSAPFVRFDGNDVFITHRPIITIGLIY